MSALSAGCPLRRLLAGAGLVLVLVLLVLQGSSLAGRPNLLPLDDFVEYWAAGRLNAEGANPYDPARLHELQNAAGRGAPFPIMMWNPPWTLSLVLPLGLLPAHLGRLLWFVVNVGVLAFCADALWRLYGGEPRRRLLAWAIAFAFLPTHFLLWSGQIAPFLLLGVVGFLAAQHRGRYWAAGAATVLIAIKPQLVYLFWPALLLWALDRRRWSVLAGAALTALLALVPPLLCNPAVVWQYGDALLRHPPAQWISPTLGSLLRLAFGTDRFWLQFVPPLLGLAWFVPYWVRHRRTWDWAEQMPWLLLVSFLTASYGAWPYDLVVLLVPVLATAVRVVQRGDREGVLLAAVCYLAFDGLAWAMNLLHFSAEWFIWMTPALLLGCLLCGRGRAPGKPAAGGFALERCHAGTAAPVP
jgi:hypothetical protein